MKYYSVVVAISVSSLCLVESAKLPSSFKLCQRNDPDLNKCFKEAVQVALPLLKDGIPELGIPSTQPLVIKSMSMDGGTGAVNIKQKYENIKIYDIISSKVESAELKIKDNSFHAILSIIVPKCKADADYDLDGKVLMLPITGTGHCVVEFEDSKVLLIMNGGTVQKKGKTYFKLDDLKAELKPTKAQFHFDNLFNGDKELGDRMTTLINESWKDFYDEVKDGFNDMLAGLVRNVADNVFNKVPYDDLLP